MDDRFLADAALRFSACLAQHRIKDLCALKWGPEDQAPLRTIDVEGELTSYCAQSSHLIANCERLFHSVARHHIAKFQ